jgi:hypothetical protein
MLVMKKKGLALALALVMLFLSMGSNHVSGAQQEIRVVSNYQAFKEYMKESILTQRKKIEVRVSNYNANVYSLTNVIRDLGESDPETTFLFAGGYNGRIRGVSNSSERVITYDFEYRNLELLPQLKEMPTVRNTMDLKEIVKNDFQNYREGSLIKIIGYQKDHYDLGNLVELTLMENPGYGTGYKGIRFTIYGQGSDAIIHLTYRFHYTMQQIIQMRKEGDLKATRVVTDLIQPTMKDYEKLLILHDYIVDNTAYDIENYRNGSIPASSRSVYGVLVKGIAVCEGYANALKKLLDLAGVESMIVVGRTESDAHAWNLVKIGGSYYHVDPTWNDPITSSGKQILRHDYFNVTDQVLEKTHQWNRSLYPIAGNTQYNYQNVLKAIENDKLERDRNLVLGGSLSINQAIENKQEVNRSIQTGKDSLEKGGIDGVLQDVHTAKDKSEKRPKETLVTIRLEEDPRDDKEKTVDGVLWEDGESFIQNDLIISTRELLILNAEDPKDLEKSLGNERINITNDFLIGRKEDQVQRPFKANERRSYPLLFILEMLGIHFNY